MATIPYPTRNDLAAAVRATSIALLNQNLVDLLDLGMQIKHAHWNVKGPHFIALHEFFDELAESLEEFVDDIAERAVELGGVADGTVQALSSTRLAAYSTQGNSGTVHIVALANAFAICAANVRAAIDAATEAGDADSADLFTGVSRGLDKMLWQLEAHTHDA
jgi:starvation-inducible DNA-binding protein